MSSILTRAKAVLEVVALYCFTFVAMWAVHISPLHKWEIRVLQRPFLVNAMMMALPVLLLAVTRRSLAAHGISFKPIKYHLNVALACALPVAVANVPHAFLDSRRWDGALIMAGVETALLFGIAWLLRNKRTAGSLGAISTFVFLSFTVLPSSGPTIGKAVSAFVFFLFFVGPAEEILFRGYIQSRLNAAFGRPYCFFGVKWGWGVIITALLFGWMHVLNLTNLFAGELDLQWWWGVWTFFGSLVFSFVREKTGSIVAPAILHGFPQAIIYPLLGL